MPQSYHINLCVEVTVIKNGWEVVVGNKCSTPDAKEFVNGSMREMCFDVKDLGKLKPRSQCEGGPIVV